MDVLFAQTGEDRQQDKMEKKRKMKVIRCVATFNSSFLPTWMTCCHGNSTSRTCELKKTKKKNRLALRLLVKSRSPSSTQSVLRDQLSWRERDLCMSYRRASACPVRTSGRGCCSLLLRPWSKETVQWVVRSRRGQTRDQSTA